LKKIISKKFVYFCTLKISIEKYMQLQQLIQAAYADRNLLQDPIYSNAVKELVENVDKGHLRTAEPIDGKWQVNEWVKQGILLYFGVMPMGIMQEGPEQYYDKIPLKMGMQELGIRTVPGSIIRHGAYVSKGVICMPSFINIGAYVDEGTMVDTWATVGSCAQIGKHVHLSGGVGIGGVLEPLQASPVIIEDHAFIGSRCIVVEGVVVETEAVLGANVVLTQSTKIIDVSGANPIEYKGRVPARSVVIPGSYSKKFAAGDYQVNCALIIGQRKASTDTKTSLNDALRDFGVSV
jgi:2,3,4,5-tetrahydropyridine-2,6-dicarboxylate N-succinyltransferase